MKMNNNSKDEIKEEKAGMELMPEDLDKVSGGTSNEAEEENQKRKRRIEQEEVGKKKKP